MSHTRIYVGNIPFSTTEDDLTRLFEAHGRVSGAEVVMDRRTGRSRGFAFVEFEDAAAAEAACKAFDGTELGGRPIKVSGAHERRPSDAGRS